MESQSWWRSGWWSSSWWDRDTRWQHEDEDARAPDPPRAAQAAWAAPEPAPKPAVAVWTWSEHSTSSEDVPVQRRVESAFNLSFWAKEGAFDWSWLGLDPVNERLTDELLVSMEWQCYRESEQQLVQTFLDIPWPCAASHADV